MDCTQELVVSLNKLTLPSHLVLNKLILSASHSSAQVFVQNEKMVRGAKVHFYRENLFLPRTKEPITFNIFRIEDDGRRFLQKTLKVDPVELALIDHRPVTFTTSSEGYELSWDCWLFRENSSQLDQVSDRDYSQLDLPFKNQDSPSTSRILVDSQVQNCGRRESRLGRHLRRRSSSTEETSSHGSNCKDWKGNQNIMNQPSQPYSLYKQQRGPSISSLEKRKSSVNSHLYSGLAAEVSEFFCQKNHQ